MAIASSQFSTRIVVQPYKNQAIARKLLRLLQFPGAIATRIWWHSKAYSVIFTIVALAALSLLFLWIEAASRKWIPIFAPKDRSSQRLDDSKIG